MTIRVTGPDGRVVNFPEGTPSHEIEREMDIFYGVQAEAQRDRLNATTALTAPRKRGAGERFADVWSHTINTSWIAEGWRAGFNDAAEYQAAGRAHKEGEPIPDPAGFALNPSRLIARLVSSGYMGFDAVTGRDTLANVTNEMVRDERARRAEFSRESSEDPFWEAGGGVAGKALHGAAALTATLVGAATDPTSYITGGSSIWGKVAVQAAVAGGVDVLAQADAVGLTQDKFEIDRTLLSAGAGAAFTGAFELAPRVGSNMRQGYERVLARRTGQPYPTNEAIARTIREDLDAADAVTRPLLTSDDIRTSPLPDGIPLKDVTPKETSVPARVEADPRVEGPEVKSAEEVNAEAGAKADEPNTDPWNGVDWGLAGSPERAKAAMAHVDRLRQFVKPEQIDNFVRWLSHQDVEIAPDASHWNRDIFNFETLKNDPDKFEELTNVMADIFRPMYDAAGKATQTWKATSDRATLFGITLSDAIKAHADLTGEGGAAAKIHALETIAIQQTDELLSAIGKLETEIGKDGIKNAATIEAVAAQLQAAKYLDAMAGGAKSEMGRALNIMKMAKQRSKVVNDIQASWDALQDGLGGGTLSDEALAAALKRMREAYGEGGAKQARHELRKIRELGFWDYVSYYIVTGYLSNPATALVNVTGSVLHATMTVGERYVGATLGHGRRAILGKRTSAEQVTYREANAYVHGVHQNFVDASRMAWQALKTGKPITDNRTSVGDTAPAPFEFNAARAQKWRRQGVAAIPDMAGVALFVTLRTLGIRPSVAADEFTKVMGRGMQLNALAVRDAMYRSARLTGKERDRVFNRTLEAVQRRPTAEALAQAKQAFDEIGEEWNVGKNYMGDDRLEEAADILAAVNLQEAANDYARMITFQKSGPHVEAAERFLNRFRFIKAVYIPFFRTPVNLVRVGMIDHNPALAWVTRENREGMKDFFRVMSENEAALNRGGAEADMVIARMVTGLGFMSMASMLFANGDLVGKRSKAEEEDGVKSYSIRINGRWHQYSRLSPMAEMLGLVADMQQVWRDRETTDNDLMAMGGGVLQAIMSNIVNKAALQGIGDFWELMDSPFARTNEQRGQQFGSTFVRKVASTVTPALIRNIAWEQDPVMRQAQTLLEHFTVNLPGLSESVAERRDWLGLPILRSPENSIVIPFRQSELTDDIVRREVSVLVQNDPDLKLAANPPARFNGQTITPREHARLLEIQGQEFRHPMTGLNMHEALTELVNSPDFSDMADPQRAKAIRDMVSQYRSLGTAAIKRGEYPDLTEMVNRTGSAEAVKFGAERGLDAIQIENRARAYGAQGITPEDLDALMGN